MNYERRLERLEQSMVSQESYNVTLVLLHPGEDKAAKVAEAKREHGESTRIIVVSFGKGPDRG